MKTIYKFKIKEALNEFDAPVEAQAISVMLQHESDGVQPVVYFKCERAAPKAKHCIRLIATAQSFEDSEVGYFIGSLLIPGPDGMPPYVVHVFHKQLGIVQPI